MPLDQLETQWLQHLIAKANEPAPAPAQQQQQYNQVHDAQGNIYNLVPVDHSNQPQPIQQTQPSAAPPQPTPNPTLAQSAAPPANRTPQQPLTAQSIQGMTHSQINELWEQGALKQLLPTLIGQ